MLDGYARRTRGCTRRTKMTRDKCDDGQRFEEDVGQNLGQDVRQVRARFEREVGQDLGRVHAGHVQHMKFVLSVRVARVPMSGCTCSRCAKSLGSIVFWGFYGRSDGFHGFRTDSTFAMSDFPRESTDSTDSISYNKKDILRYFFLF